MQEIWCLQLSWAQLEPLRIPLSYIIAYKRTQPPSMVSNKIHSERRPNHTNTDFYTFSFVFVQATGSVVRKSSLIAMSKWLGDFGPYCIQTTMFELAGPFLYENNQNIQPNTMTHKQSKVDAVDGATYL